MATTPESSSMGNSSPRPGEHSQNMPLLHDSDTSSVSQFAAHLRSGTVQILVGPSAVRFDIHRSLLCSNSDYFQAALNGTWKESDGTLRLPDDDAAVFELLAQWLYTGKSDTAASGEKLDNVGKGVRAYILADKLQFTSMQPLILDYIRAYHCIHSTFFTVPEIEFIYENTPPIATFLLRRLAVQEIAYAFLALAKSDHGLRDLTDFIPEFAFALIKEMRIAHRQSVDNGLLLDPRLSRSWDESSSDDDDDDDEFSTQDSEVFDFDTEDSTVHGSERPAPEQGALFGLAPDQGATFDENVIPTTRPPLSDPSWSRRIPARKGRRSGGVRNSWWA